MHELPPENVGGVYGQLAKTPDPIYDQTLRFSLPYL